MDKYDDHYARWSYEQLLLQQPHISFEGLWRLGFLHYIVCPSLDTARTLDGETLRAWFDHKCRVITAPVQLVAACPDGAEKVPERSAEDRAVLAGAPRTRRDALVDMSVALPPEFPAFTIDNPGGDVVLVTNRPLTADEQSQAESTYRRLGHFAPLHFGTDAKRNFEQEKFRFNLAPLSQGDINLIPSRRLGSSVGRALRFLVEEDEQIWVRQGHALLAALDSTPDGLLPDSWVTSRKLSCLVDATVFAPENLRTYLSLYDTVCLTVPLETEFDKNLAALGVKPDELLSVVQTGRVRLLLPQALDRYPRRWLSAVAETAPQNMMLSRRLAAATIADARRRVPLLYPPLAPRERYALLHALSVHAEELVGATRKETFIKLVGKLGDSWSGAEWAVQTRGAMGTAHHGIGMIAAEIYERVTGRDLRIELWSASQKVEWAAALSAHAFPSAAHGHDEANACDLVSGLYGPTGARRSVVAPLAALSAINDLLAIDNRVSIVHFAKEFSSAEVNRLRDLVLRLTRENVDPDYLAHAIDGFNAEVRRYEKRPDLLKSVNVVGFFSAGAVAAGAVDPEIQKVVPLAGMLLGFVVNRIIDELPRYSATGGRVVDFLNSALTGRASPDAVLVARARREIGRLKT